MRHIMGLGVVLGLALTGMATAQAAPSISGVRADHGPIVLVEGGCGPYAHRNPYGYCRPNGPPPPPRYYRCPPGTHPTPYGCRPNY